MNYIQLDDNKWIKTNGTSVSIIYSKVLQDELVEINKRLMEIPTPLDDSELLAWAKMNYPAMDYSVERTTLDNRKSEIDLSNMGL